LSGVPLLNALRISHILPTTRFRETNERVWEKVGVSKNVVNSSLMAGHVVSTASVLKQLGLLFLQRTENQTSGIGTELLHNAE